MTERKQDFENLASERSILQSYANQKQEFETTVTEVDGESTILLPDKKQDVLGLFRKREASKAVIADMELHKSFAASNLTIPSFLEAGPRPALKYDPLTVRAAVVTTGGVAPGLHCVIHSIVKRHIDTYSMSAATGRIFGVFNSFKGMCALADNITELTPGRTEEWLDQGGSKLGSVRFYLKDKGGQDLPVGDAIPRLADEITKNLENNRIDILYVIGGDGSLKTAHEIARRNPNRSIVGIPKTMDNDVLWVWQSFGFNTAVEQATRVINTLRSEAEAVRRICLIELFGAESGFVAANATLASGHVDAVLIPEVFKALAPKEAEGYLGQLVEYIGKRVGDMDERKHSPHAVVVLAEGVGTILEKNGVEFHGTKVTKKGFVELFESQLKGKIKDAHGERLVTFVNQPRHHIRAVAANSFDQIYCERLGALAVDTALAGFTDCMVSQWLTEFVLVPLNLVMLGKKCIPINGMFWKQVVSSTGQPLSLAERIK